MKYTPGPWGCIDTSNHAHDYRLTNPDGTSLPVNAPANDHSEQRANARLIAKAPELVDAVKTLLLVVEDFMPNIGKCVLQDYMRLNDGLIAATALIKEIERS